MNENKLFEEELINAVNLEAAPPTEEPERQYYYIAKARKYVKELSEKLGRPLFAHVTTFGCAVEPVMRMLCWLWRRKRMFRTG